MIFMLLLLLFPIPASALEWLVEGGAGASLFQRTTPDGTWCQEGLGQGCKFDNQDLAFRAGVGLQLNPNWSLGLNYLNLGTVSAVTTMVGDADYDLATKRCLQNCGSPQVGRTWDRLDGGELIATYTYTRWLVEPYVRGGMALMRHQFSWHTETPGYGFTNYTLNGILVMGVGGVGACVQWLCADVSAYKSVGSTGVPLSNAVLVPMVVGKWRF